MISPILPAHDATTIALDFGVFIAEQARTHRVSQTAIIAALRPCITPSQPEGPSKPHAPAADTPATQAAGVTTDGGVSTSSLTSPSVKPSKRGNKRAQVLATHAEHPDWPSKLIAQHLGISEDAVRATASRKGLKLVSWWDYERSLKAQTRQALAASVAKPPEAEEPPVEPQAAPKPETPPADTPAPAKRITMADKIAAYVADHPNATAREVADAIDAKITSVNWAAKSAGITLRRMISAELSEATSKGITGRRASVPAKPELPPLSKPSDRLPLPPPIVRPARTTPTGRFYLREKAVIGKPVRYVHQSLSPCPTGPGPLMTLDRKWAWFDTMDRYRGALKQWPQITSMIKEAVSS
jgi:hypothetical protein